VVTATSTANAAAVTRIAFIGFGQLGSAIARGLAAQPGVDVSAYDPVTDAPMRERAQAAGVRLLARLADLADADIVLSTVTPLRALEAAQSCAPALAPDAIYVDLNSLGPREKRAVAEAIAAVPRRFVDGAVLGAAADGYRVMIIASGADAEEVATRLSALGMRVRAVGVEPGQAASIKIVRSVLAKGLEALYVEALVAARRLGVEREVLTTFCEFLDARPAAATAELLVTTHVKHAERRMHELEMSVAAVAETGLEPRLARAIRDVLAATAAKDVAAKFGGEVPPNMDAALAALDESLGVNA
jgi:3-hydroxyisobutyrate dehydrogenase